ncbi:MAG: toxin-antitoxin system YwqK family antitoxin [Cyclobacteriaceae bacterium]
MHKYYLIIWLIFLSLIAEAQDTFVKKTYYDMFDKIVKDAITVRKKDSVADGKYQSYFQSGSLESKGFYLNGEIDSVWTFYYQNGRKKAFGSYRLGKPRGVWRYYFESGDLKSEGILSENQKSGSWAYYYENGKVKSSGKYVAGNKVGIWNYFYEDESLKSQAFYSGEKADYKEFYPNGSLKSKGIIINEKSTGLWTYYYESGEKEAEGSFKNGLRIGIWKYYYKNQQISAEGEFTDGNKTGLWKYYHKDGSLSAEGAMNQDAKDGFWKLFYPTGELKGEANYDSGTGLSKEYYPGGQLRAIGKIENDKKEGLWKYYNEAGVLDGEANFQKGEGIYTGFYNDGTMKMQGKIENDRRTGEWTLYNTDNTVAGTYRPVYEELNPIFRTGEIIENQKRKESRDKPEYRYKNNKLRYFEPNINEYRGIIMGTNPLWTLIGQLPVAVEYYIQERMGYEMNINIHKKPFYRNSSSLDLLDIRTNGISLTMRQKFYHEGSKLGMFYFGHEIQAGFLAHHTSAIDSSGLLSAPVTRNYEASQRRFAYSLLVGNRWMQRDNDSGFSIDFHIGVGIGGRYFNLDYIPNQTTGRLFNDINQDQFYIPLIIGVNIGFAGPKRRSTSF